MNTSENTQTNSLDQFIIDIENQAYFEYPLLERRGRSILECCEDNPSLFAQVLRALSIKWNIDSDLMDFVQTTASAGIAFCIEGFLGRVHKDRFASKQECGSCRKIKQRFQILSAYGRSNAGDFWNKPREFTLKKSLQINSLHQLIIDIENQAYREYPMLERRERTILQCCEDNAPLFARVLTALSAKWNIDPDLINFVHSTAYADTTFCIEGFLGRPHKDRHDPKHECRSCQKIKQGFELLIICGRSNAGDFWNKPREFTQFGNSVASSRP